MKNSYDEDDDNIKMLPSQTTGAAHELLACADLMKKGLHVYRAQSPNCSCDLIAMDKNGNLFRIEVTTGKHNKNGLTYYSKHDNGRCMFDVIAVYFNDNSKTEWYNRNYEPIEFPPYQSA